MITKIKETLLEKKSYLISLFLSVFAALLIGAVLMIVTGYNPIEGYAAMLKGAFGSSRVFGNTMAKMLTLCLTGLAMAVGSQAGMFNVGGEGQLFLGGLAATMTAVYLQGVSPFIAVPLAFISAAVAGGIYAWIPAVLKVKLNVSEVITTIMLNSVAIYLCTYLTNSSGPLRTHDRGVMAGTDAVPKDFMFEQVIARSNLSTAWICGSQLFLSLSSRIPISCIF